MSKPIAGASYNAAWQWVDGELVYTPRPRWVAVPREQLGGALAAEIRADFRQASGIGRQRQPRWTDLRAEIAQEFAPLTTRADELELALDRRCSKLARQVAGRARVGRCAAKQRALTCWVCHALITTRSSHRSYCSRKCKRRSYHARDGAEHERAYMRQWRARKAGDAGWLKAARLQRRESSRRCERKQRRLQLSQRPARQCPECAAQFVPLLAKRVYCSDGCKHRAAQRRYWRAHSAKLNAARNERRAGARVAQRRAA